MGGGGGHANTLYQDKIAFVPPPISQDQTEPAQYSYYVTVLSGMNALSAVSILFIEYLIFFLPQYSLHITLVDQCLKLYRDGINDVCKVEQNLATGTDPQGEPITDPMKDMMPCLFNRKIR